MKDKNQEAKVSKQEFYSLFLIIFPSLIIGSASVIDSIFVRLMIQTLAFVLQIITVKGILDDYYQSKI